MRHKTAISSIAIFHKPKRTAPLHKTHVGIRNMDKSPSKSSSRRVSVVARECRSRKIIVTVEFCHFVRTNKCWTSFLRYMGAMKLTGTRIKTTRNFIAYRCLHGNEHISASQLQTCARYKRRPPISKAENPILYCNIKHNPVFVSRFSAIERYRSRKWDRKIENLSLSLLLSYFFPELLTRCLHTRASYTNEIIYELIVGK